MRVPAIPRLICVSCAILALGATLPAASRAAISLTHTIELEIETNPYSVISADFNRDRALDLAATGYDAGVVSILLGNGDGTFRPRTNFATGEGAISVAAGDLTSDDSIADMRVAPGATADQSISATDPDGDVITFIFSGPSFVTLTSNPQVGPTRTGNLHLGTRTIAGSGHLPPHRAL